MADPMTIGALAAYALSIAGGEAVKGFVGEAAKDAYKQLKDVVARWAGTDVEALEKTPSSAKRQEIIAEVIDAQPADELERVKALATALVAALKSEAVKDGATHPVALDMGKLTDVEVQLDSITVTQGKGAVVGEMRGGTFRAGPINVGTPPGKSEK
jgi:hypothetical protein